ncbi:MAG: hypothetical protein M3O74_12760 [Pseudomonadota bacterium]|jgi:hypothetical protein|uniref:hypothetical protein n=1 Tax=Burkholderiaceae TaxID=119060 RepID=UPI0011808ADF|nr:MULTISPECIES: hypothetical protein [Burkholderiaceae]MDP9155108.1 hypothetical protein [Pseudomonadota bacterium]
MTMQPGRRAIDAMRLVGYARLYVENGALRQNYRAVYTIYPRKMLSAVRARSAYPCVARRANPDEFFAQPEAGASAASQTNLLSPTLFLNVSGQSWTNN